MQLELVPTRFENRSDFGGGTKRPLTFNPIKTTKVQSKTEYRSEVQKLPDCWFTGHLSIHEMRLIN